jgi:hypothetical protein
MVAYTWRHADLVAKREEMSSQEPVGAPTSPSAIGQSDPGTKRGGTPAADGDDENPPAKKKVKTVTVRANTAESAQLGTAMCCLLLLLHALIAASQHSQRVGWQLARVRPHGCPFLLLSHQERNVRWNGAGGPQKRAKNAGTTF